MDNSGYRLSHFLDIEKITQRKVAIDMGCAPSYVNVLCSGKKPIGKQTAHKLQYLYNVSAGWLLTGQGPMYADDSDAVHKPAEAQIDQSSLINAAIAGRDIAIENLRANIEMLKKQLDDTKADKNSLIEALRHQLDDKNEIISTKDALIASLRAQLRYSNDDYSYDLRVAEETT